MPVYLHFITYFDFHDSGAGGRELLWPKFFLIVDAQLILLRNNMNGFVIIWDNSGGSAAIVCRIHLWTRTNTST